MSSKFLPLIFCVLTFNAQSQSQIIALQRCPTIEDSAARLACYDAAMPPTIAVPRLPVTQNMPLPHTTSASTPARTSRQPNGETAFGLPKERDAAEVQAIESTTLPNFSQWGPNERIRLENGQVWQVTDGSRGTLINVPSKVTIKKGLFGAFFMVFQERNWSPKVQRLE